MDKRAVVADPFRCGGHLDLECGANVRWIACGWVVLVLGSIALQMFLFLVLPRMALKLAGGNRDRERRILQWLVDTPFPGALKIFARFKLALNSQVAKHYAQAEEAYRSILEDGGNDLDAGLESTIRQNLADTLEARAGRRGHG